MRRWIVLLWGVTSMAYAQENDKDFQSFRKGLLNDYQQFRQTVRENYATYLEGVWKEYQLFRGEARSHTPKPKVAPTADSTPDVPKQLPAPDVKPVMAPMAPTPLPDTPVPVIQPMTLPQLHFTFYGVRMEIPRIPLHRAASMQPDEVANAWKAYQNDSYEEVTRALRQIATSYGLNDWFIQELIREYVHAMLQGEKAVDRVVLQHFLLTNLGIDARLAQADQQLLLLLPFRQKVYERSYILIDAQRYYVFYDHTASHQKEGRGNIYSCEIPPSVDKGRVIDMSFRQSALALKSGADRERILSDGKITVRAVVNTGQMEMLRHYPPMDISTYAQSSVCPSLHQAVAAQVKRQVEGLPQREAAQALLHFVQYAFSYATDDEQHGYEKPYFLEENFYYPQNDCEDRSIFYAFLVREVLGLEVHLVGFPGHECTAVRFTEKGAQGDSYRYEGQTFTICDPTYIGASIGQCMPDYKNCSPEIEIVD